MGGCQCAGGPALLLLLRLLWRDCYSACQFAGVFIIIVTTAIMGRVSWGVANLQGVVLIAVIATIMGRLSWGCQAAGRYCFTLVIIPYGKEKMLFPGQLVL